jgi:hypothetical protein
MTVQETVPKSMQEIFEEVKPLQKEIRLYIKDYLPRLHLKGFMFEEQKLGPFAINRQFRLMCLLFRKQLKDYNLDPRSKLAIFFGAKCSLCASVDNLELHHKHKDGKQDRAIFDEYEVSIWSYYLIHLDEAVDCLKLLCKNCHYEAHNSTGFFNIFDEMMEIER